MFHQDIKIIHDFIIVYKCVYCCTELVWHMHNIIGQDFMSYYMNSDEYHETILYEKLLVFTSILLMLQSNNDGFINP